MKPGSRGKGGYKYVVRGRLASRVNWPRRAIGPGGGLAPGGLVPGGLAPGGLAPGRLAPDWDRPQIKIGLRGL